VPFLAAVVARVAVVFAAAAGASSVSTLLLLIAQPVLATATAFADARLGAALARLLVLHPRQPLLLSEQLFTAHTRGRISFFFIPSSFDRPQTAGYLLNRPVGNVKHQFN
jgi:hypothetical protein